MWNVMQKKKQFKMHRGEDRFWCLHLDTSSAVVFNRYHVSVKLVSKTEAHNGMVSTDEDGKKKPILFNLRIPH